MGVGSDKSTPDIGMYIVIMILLLSTKEGIWVLHNICVCVFRYIYVHVVSLPELLFSLSYISVGKGLLEFAEHACSYHLWKLPGKLPNLYTHHLPCTHTRAQSC